MWEGFILQCRSYFSSMMVWLSFVTSQIIFSSSAMSTFGLSRIATTQQIEIRGFIRLQKMTLSTLGNEVFRIFWRGRKRIQQFDNNPAPTPKSAQYWVASMTNLFLQYLYMYMWIIVTKNELTKKNWVRELATDTLAEKYNSGFRLWGALACRLDAKLQEECYYLAQVSSIYFTQMNCE